MGLKWKAGLAGGALVVGSLAMTAPVSAASAPQSFIGTINIQADGTQTVTLTGGVFGSGVTGPDITTSEKSTGQDGNGSHDNDALMFDNGVVNVKDSSSATSKNQSFDPTTCTATFGGTGTFQITGGTGAYAGISGHGHFTVSFTAVFPSDGNGGCNTDGPPDSASGTVNITGVASL